MKNKAPNAVLLEVIKLLENNSIIVTEDVGFSFSSHAMKVLTNLCGIKSKSKRIRKKVVKNKVMPLISQLIIQGIKHESNINN